MIIKHIQTEYCAQAWPLVENYIAEAFKQSGGDDYTLDQAKVFVCMGQWLLLVAIDEQEVIHGAATINFINYPNDRVAFITSIGGKLISNSNTFDQMVYILKQFGATKIQGAARESVARLWRRFGFKERYITVETKI
jgi:hypothetical protein